MNGDTIIIGIATIAITIALAVVAWAMRFGRGENTAISAAAAAKDAHQRLDTLNKEFGDFKEHVAREYVPNAAILQLEKRMSEEFTRVRDSLDRLFEPRRIETRP